jgi:long-chain acyl-CoA synthetase
MKTLTTTTGQLLSQTAASNGARVAMRHKTYGLWQEISWTDYWRAVRSLGAALIDRGLAPGDRVAIIGDNCPEWVFIDMAVQSIGGVSVGVYATNAWEQVQYIVNHCQARFLFVENEEQLDKWLQFRGDAPSLEGVVVWDTKGLREFKDPMVTPLAELSAVGRGIDTASPGSFDARMGAVSPEDVAVLIYTSGTTGPPKGAMLTHTNVTWMAGAVAEANPIFRDDAVLSFLPLCHIFERLFSVFVHVAHAYTVHFVEKADTVTDNMREVSPTIGYAVPRIWEKYYSAVKIRMSDATWFKRTVFNIALRIGDKWATQRMARPTVQKPVPGWLQAANLLAYGCVFRKLKERLGFERMRVAYSGAAPISGEVLQFFQSIGINLIEGYGQTEGTGVTTLSRSDSVKFGSVGTALSGTQIRIAEDGEILISSPGVFKGYFDAPESTADTLRDGWLHTGDVGRLDDDGYLTITDRKKDIIITAGGKNITPQYIENKLKASIYVNDAVVIGDRRKFLSALVAIDEDNVVKYAQDHKLQFATYRDLTANEGIHALIKAEVEGVNATLARVEQIRKFRLIPKKLYEEDGEVTPTMKVKRKYIHQAFEDLIEEMYARPKAG